MPGQFLWGAVLVLLIALLLSQTFPGRRPAASATVEEQAPPVLARDAAPTACREGRRPLLDAGGGLVVAC